MSNADWAIPLVVAQPGSELKARFATTALVKETRDYWCAAKDAEMPQALVFGVRGGAARPITRVALEPPRYDLGSCVNAFEVLAGESEDALTSLGSSPSRTTRNGGTCSRSQRPTPAWSSWS